MENDIKADINNGQGEEAKVKELHSCTQEVVQLKEALVRLTADFDNARKNTEKELVRSRTLAQAMVLNDLLAVMDDFERAFADLSKHVEKRDGSYMGFELIYKGLLKLLHKYGVEEITENTHFDPELHEAVMQVTQEDTPSGTIVTVLQKGYRFKGTVLRPAKVSVAQ